MCILWVFLSSLSTHSHMFNITQICTRWKALLCWTYFKLFHFILFFSSFFFSIYSKGPQSSSFFFLSSFFLLLSDFQRLNVCPLYCVNRIQFRKKHPLYLNEDIINEAHRWKLKQRKVQKSVFYVCIYLVHKVEIVCVCVYSVLCIPWLNPF